MSNQLDLTLNYYKLNPDEFIALFDDNLTIVYASTNFLGVYSNNLNEINKNLFELEYFYSQSDETKEIIRRKIKKQEVFILTSCINKPSITSIRQLRFRKILIDDSIHWEICSFKYGLINLFSHYSEHYDAYLNRLFISRFKQEFNKFSDYQVAICFLVAHNYSNQQIADIINQANPQENPRSRHAINTRINDIRFLFDIPSKEMFIECLHRAGILSYTPKMLLQNQIILY